MQNFPQQRKGFVESEVIDFPRTLDMDVPSASISCDLYSQKPDTAGVLTQLHAGILIGHKATDYPTTKSARRILLFLYS